MSLPRCCTARYPRSSFVCNHLSRSRSRWVCVQMNKTSHRKVDVMKLFSRMLVVAAAVTAMAGTAVAQTAPGLLNKLEVQRLVAAHTPAAHASLAKHFVALTETYKAEAARYRALATGFTGNPNHWSGIDPGARRARQADAAVELALNARAMAAYHQLLSVGSAATAPRVAVTFDSGFGAPAPTQAQLSQLEKSARTPTDQRGTRRVFPQRRASGNGHGRRACGDGANAEGGRHARAE